jgi:arylsulfatase A-like enzyme
MSRSVLLAPLACLLVLTSSVRAVEENAANASRPNLVFFFCDDLATQAISAYGHELKLLETPNMDRLAKEGMLFQRCVVPNSICGPSRAVIQTGKYSHLNGFYHNNSRFDGSQPTFPKLLQGAGYQTAVIGKWHLVSDPQGFDHWHILPGQGAYYNPPMIRDGEQVKHTGYTTDLISEFSTEWVKNRDKTKPFLLMSQHKAPHREWAPALRHLGWNGDRTFAEPKTLFDDYSGRGIAELEQDMTLAKTFTERDAKLVPTPGLTPEQLAIWNAYYEPRNAAVAKLSGEALVRWRYQRYMHDYLGTVKAVDEAMGALLDTLEAEGIVDETLVILSSDQGFYLGEHGWFDKRWIYEESLTTPLLARWPGKIAPGTRGGGMVSIIDFPETFLEAAGLSVPDDMQGRSLVPFFRSGGKAPAGWRTSFYYHYYEFPGPHSVRKHYGVVTDRYKLFHFYEPETNYWTLIDRKSDPDEMTNVYGNADYAAVQGELHAELKRLRAELKVPDQDAPESLMRPGQGQVQGGKGRIKGKANAKSAE